MATPEQFSQVVLGIIDAAQAQDDKSVLALFRGKYREAARARRAAKQLDRMAERLQPQLDPFFDEGPTDPIDRL